MILPSGAHVNTNPRNERYIVDVVTLNDFRRRVRQVDQRALVRTLVFFVIVACYTLGFLYLTLHFYHPGTSVVRPWLLMLAFSAGLLFIIATGSRLLSRTKASHDLYCSGCMGVLSGDVAGEVIRTRRCPHCNAELILCDSARIDQRTHEEQ